MFTAIHSKGNGKLDILFTETTEQEMVIRTQVLRHTHNNKLWLRHVCILQYTLNKQIVIVLKLLFYSTHRKGNCNIERAMHFTLHTEQEMVTETCFTVHTEQ